MSDPVEILHAYAAAFRSGEPADPLEYLGRADPARRDELADLMEAFHSGQGRRPYDAAAFERSPARAAADEAARAVLGSAGLWPSLLPRLRMRAEVSRAEVVRRLASDLGVADREEKVRTYYHEMELGSLPSAGVADRVLVALGRIVGESAQALREAGRAVAAAPPAAGAAGPGVAFARRAAPDPRYAPGAPAPAVAGAPQERSEPDEVDELFRGGGQARGTTPD